MDRRNFLLPAVLVVACCVQVDSQQPAVCPGPCTLPQQCSYHGGRLHWPCGPSKVCCEYGGSSGTCGTVSSGNKVSNFKSPGYPNYSSGSLVCKFDIQLNADTTGMRIDFLDIQMDTTPVGAKFFEEASPACDSDMFFIKGFKDWSPDPRCGNLTGYSTLIEIEPAQPVLSIVFVMSSFAYKWHMRMTEITAPQINQANQILNNKVFLSSPMNSPRFYPGRPLLPRAFTTNMEDRILGTPLIGGGQDAQPSSVPWQVSIQTVPKFPAGLCGEPKNLSVHFCGGSIIDDTTVLTAAHCFLTSAKYPHPMMDITLIKVVVGEHDLCKEDEVSTTRSYPIVSVLFHFNYLAMEILNDVAIIKLAMPIQFNQGVQPIPIGPPGIQTENGVTALLSGWGSYGTEQNATSPPILQQTTSLDILSDQECFSNTVAYLQLNPRQRLSLKYRTGLARGVCTRGKETVIEAGYGDSGGPLAVLDNSTSRYYLLGVVSHKRQETDQKNGKTVNLNYFGRASDYANWILMALVHH